MANGAGSMSLAIDYQRLFARILQAVDHDAYLTPTENADPAQRPALDQIRAALRAEPFEADRIRVLVRRLHDDGELDRVHMLSALHVIAAHPRVKDYAEAARLAGEQEQAAMELGGPRVEANLASVDRHRGVLAFLQSYHGVALDHFTRALERQRTPENLGNVLAALLALGEIAEAEAVLVQVRRMFSPSMIAEIDHRIDTDPDLALLRAAEAS